METSTSTTDANGPRSWRRHLPALAILAVACLWLWWAGARLAHGIASDDWPTVRGKLVTAEVVVTRTQERQQNNAVIEYRYVVDGETYHADELSFRGIRDELGFVRERDAGRGAWEVTVSYRPSDPGTAVLVPGYDWWNIVQILFGLVLVAAAAQVWRFTAV